MSDIIPCSINHKIISYVENNLEMNGHSYILQYHMRIERLNNPRILMFLNGPNLLGYMDEYYGIDCTKLIEEIRT